jgi:hypothetical protein
MYDDVDEGLAFTMCCYVINEKFGRVQACRDGGQVVGEL